jgi:predicted permease
MWLDRILRRRRIYDDLAEEIQAHLDEKIDALMAQGASPEEARDAARRAFGNVTSMREQGRETWEWPTIESFIMDVRFAVRQIRRAPAVSVIVVATLAIGIAATTTVFSWTRSVLLNALPGVGDASRVMALECTTSSGGWTPTSWLDYRDFRKYLRSFDGLAAAYPTTLGIGDDVHTERRHGELVSANFFDVLRVRPALGGFFPSSLDEAEGAQPTVVISYYLWQARWHGDSAVIGSVVHINGFPFTIVGVTPESFHGSLPGQHIELWAPAAMLGRIVPTGGWWLRDRGTRTFRVLARLAPKVDRSSAAAEVEAFAKRMAEANGDVSKGMGGRLMPLWQSHWGVQDALRTPLLVLLSACGLVMLIVCANAANLLIARATGRSRELGLRVALGAQRARLVRQLLTEASMLAIFGAALGLLCAVWLARSLHLLVPSFATVNLIPPHVDASVLGLAVLLAMGVTLLAGVAPALYGSREVFANALHGTAGRGAVGGVHATRVRGLLVTAEMALAVVSLVGAGLFYQSYRHSRAVSPGFDASHVAMSSVSVTLAGYDSARGESFLNEVADRMRSQPGVTAVSYADYVPLSLGSGSWEDLRVEGYTPQPNENMKLFRGLIGPEYFTVLGIPFVSGRDFTLGDDSAHTHVMIVNESFVKRFLDRRPALGVRVHGWGRWFTIVGVVKDTKTYRLTDPPTPYFYVPARQVYRPEKGYTFLVRTDGGVDQTVRAIGQSVRSVDPTVAVYNAMSLSEYIEGPMQSQQAATGLLAILAAVAALLAAIGLYGVTTYAMAQRTKEIGVRVALGAQPRDVIGVVASEARGLLAGGLIFGIAGAAAMRRVVASMLYSVSMGDASVFLAAGGLMILIALVAVSVPARRAMRVDPLTALRAD